MTYEELENAMNNLREKLGEESSALVSEDLLSILSSYKNLTDEINEHEEEIENLKNAKDELLKINGKLFQKIGFEKEEEKEEKEEEKDEEIIDVNDIIDEKGDVKYE